LLGYTHWINDEKFWHCDNWELKSTDYYRYSFICFPSPRAPLRAIFSKKTDKKFLNFFNTNADYSQHSRHRIVNINADYSWYPHNELYISAGFNWRSILNTFNSSYKLCTWHALPVERKNISLYLQSRHLQRSPEKAYSRISTQ